MSAELPDESIAMLPQRRLIPRVPWLLAGFLIGISLHYNTPAYYSREAYRVVQQAERITEFAVLSTLAGLVFDVILNRCRVLPKLSQFNLRTLFLLLYGAAATAWTSRNLAELYGYLP